MVCLSVQPIYWLQVWFSDKWVLMSDRIDLETGDSAEDAIAGKSNTINRTEQRNQPRQNQRGGDTYVSSQDSQQWLIAQILDHAQQLRELTYRLDDIPNEFNKFKVKVETQGDSIKRLQDLEVVVTPSEILIRKPPDSATLPMTTVYILFGGFLLIVIILVSLLYLR